MIKKILILIGTFTFLAWLYSLKDFIEYVKNDGNDKEYK